MLRLLPSLLLPLLLLSAACSPRPDDPAAPAADEDRQLNQAADDLDVNSTGNAFP